MKKLFLFFVNLVEWFEMMRILNRRRGLYFLLGALFLPVISFAQEVTEGSVEESVELELVEGGSSSGSEEAASEVEQPVNEDPIIEPFINVERRFVQVSEAVSFDGSGSKLISPSIYGTPSYSWDFGDESIRKWGEKLTHSYEHPGKYEVQLRVTQGRKKATLVQEIVVYEKKGVIFSDNVSAEEIASSAADQGIWLEKITFDAGDVGFSSNDILAQAILARLDFIRDADILIFNTKTASEFRYFSQFVQDFSDENKIDISGKLLVQITEGSLDQIQKLIYPIFDILHPDYILLTRIEALVPIFENFLYENSREGIAAKLESRGIQNVFIDESTGMSKWLPLSNLMTYFVKNGVHQNVIYLILVVPILTFIIAFFRQFVGVSTFGVYAPLMLSLSFLVLKFKFGLIIFCTVILVSYIIRLIFEKVELLYIPRVSLLLSALSLSFFLVLGVAVYFKLTTTDLALSIFPMLVMSTLSEKFLASQSTEGIRNALVTAGETVVVSLIGYFFVQWSTVSNFILATPEYVFIPILLNIWLGRFTGLRMSEYFKFRYLFREDSQEE